MESGNIIGNSLKAIYSRMTTLESAEPTLNAVGVALNTIGENGEKKVRPVGDIIEELGMKWHTLSDAQKQHTAVTLAGRNHVTRFLALMNNFPMAIEATNTAMNSQGSAIRENAEYLESFEARINKLKNGFTEMSLAIGDAFLSGGILMAIDALGALAKMITNVADSFGALAGVGLIFGAIGTKFGLFDKFIEGAKTGLDAFNRGVVDAGQKAGGSATMMDRLQGGIGGVVEVTSRGQGAMKGFGGAIAGLGRSLFAMTGIGVIFMGIGAGLEFLIGKYQKAKHEQEEMEKAMNQMVKSYRENMNSIDELVNKYETMSAKVGNGQIEFGSKEYNEFLQIQSKLSEIMPNMVDYIDQNGQAWMRNSDELREQIELSKKLSEAKAKEASAKIDEKIEKEIESLDKLAKKYKEVAEEEERAKQYKRKGGHWSEKSDEVNENYEKMMLEASTKRAGLATKEFEARQKVTKQLSDQVRLQLEANGHLQKMSDGALKFVDNLMQVQSIEFKDTFTKFFEDGIISDKESSKLKTMMEDMINTGRVMGEAMANTFDDMSANIDSSTDEGKQAIEDLKQSIGTVGEAIPDDFMEGLLATGDIEVAQQKLQRLLELGVKIKETKGGSFDGYAQEAQKLGMSLSSAETFVIKMANASENASLKSDAMARAQEGVAGATDEVTSSLMEQNQAMIESIDLQEQLFGYKNQELSAMKGHVEALKMSQLLYGENATKTDSWKKSIVALSERLGVSQEEIANNIDEYYGLIDALGQLKTKYDENGQIVLDYGSMTDAQKAKIQEIIAKMEAKGVKLDFLTQKESEFGEALDSTTGQLDENGNAIQEHGANVNQAGEEVKQGMEKVKDGVSQAGQAGDGLAPLEEKLKGLAGVSTELKDKISQDASNIVQSLQGINTADFSQVYQKANELGLSMQEVIDISNGTADLFEISMSRIGNSGQLASPLNTPLNDIVNKFGQVDTSSQESATGIQGSMTQIGGAGGNLSPLHTGLQDVQTKMSETKTNVETNVGGINTSFSQLGQGLNNGFMSPFDQIMQGFNTNMDGMVQKVGTSAQQISNDSKTIGNAKTSLEEYKTAQENVITSLGNLGSKASEIASTVQNAGMTIGSSLSGFDKIVTKQSELKTAMSESALMAQELERTMSVVGTSIGNTGGQVDLFTTAIASIAMTSASASASLMAVGMASSGASIGMKSASQASMASALASQANANSKQAEANASQTVATASFNVVRAKQQEANAIMQAINGTRQMATAYISMSTSGMTSINGLLSVIRKYTADVLRMSQASSNVANIVKSAFSSMSGVVKSNTGAMNKAHSSQASALNKVKDAANSAKSAVQGLNSTISGAIGKLDSYIKKAQSASNVKVSAPTLPQLPTGAQWVTASTANSNDVSNVVGGFTSALSSVVGAMNASSGESGISGGTGGGTSGTLKQSSPTFNALAGDSGSVGSEMADVYEVEWYERMYKKLQTQIQQIESKMNNINKNSREYRQNLEKVIALETQRWKLVNQNLYEAEARNVEIEARIAQLNETGRHTKEQRDEYNKLQQEYDNNLSKIQSLRSEWNNLWYEIEKKQDELITNFIDELVEGTKEAIHKMERELSQIDFDLGRLQSDPHSENTEAIQEMIAKRRGILEQQSQEYFNLRHNLIAEMNKALWEHGEDSDVYKKAREAYEEAHDNLMKTYGEMKKADKDFFDQRIKSIQEMTTETEESMRKLIKEVEYLEDELSMIGLETDETGNNTEIIDIHERKIELLKAQVREYQNLKNAVLWDMNQAEKNYGTDSEYYKRVRDEYEKVLDIIKDLNKEVKESEKSIYEIRAKVADDAIDKMKDYYEKMKDMSVKAIELEKKNLEKAHDKKMKLYDEEIEKINSVYDKKFKDMDRQRDTDDYNETLNDLTEEKNELLDKISILSMDKSLEGKKRLAEIQKQLSEKEKEIADHIKEREDHLTREGLEDQREQQLENIEKKKEAEDEAHKDRMDKLEEEQERIEKYYDDIINNEKMWEEKRKEAINNGFDKLNAEMMGMYENLQNMNNGAFDSLVGNIGDFSEETMKELAEINDLLVDNLIHNLNESIRLIGEVRNADLPKDIATGNPLGDAGGGNRVIKNSSLDGISRFNTGGYTGTWSGKDAKLALLDQKELVLDKDDTSNFLNAMKIMEKVKGFIPNLQRNIVASKFSNDSISSNTENNYEVNVYIDSVTGDKNGVDKIFKGIKQGMKKLGK